MAKNFDTVTDAVWNAALADLPTPNTLFFVLIEENEESVDPTDGWADWTQVGTEALSRGSLTSSGREIDCGAALVFTAVPGGLPRAVAVLSDETDGDPEPWAVLDVNDGDTYDMDAFLDLAVDTLILKNSYPGET